MAGEKEQDGGDVPTGQRQQDMPRSGKTELGRTYGGAANAPSRRNLAGEFPDRAAEQLEGAVEWMKARPVTSAAIGLGIGVLIGLAVGRSVH
jgi:hypothetical protein